jgi:hypothetical protein
MKTPIFINRLLTVLKPSKIGVTSAAQKTSDTFSTRLLSRAARMVMIDRESIFRGGFFADGAHATLRGQHRFIIRKFNSIGTPQLFNSIPFFGFFSMNWIGPSKTRVLSETRLAPGLGSLARINSATRTESVISLPLTSPLPRTTLIIAILLRPITRRNRSGSHSSSATLERIPVFSPSVVMKAAPPTSEHKIITTINRACRSNHSLNLLNPCYN